MQNKTFIQYLSDYRWLLMIIPAILLTLPSLFGSKVDWGSSFILFSVLYIIGLLFVYQRAKWLALFALSQLPMLVLQIISLVN
ncbi:MAG: hypothetical protein FWF14_03675, partial [Streptococcaceae bacterium]|nr:hypothetical protein [Streptococcaceae bacterium]